MNDPLVVAGATLVDQSQFDKLLLMPADGCRRTELQQEQRLHRQRAPMFLVIADFDDEHTIDLGLKAREMLLHECLKSSELGEHDSLDARSWSSCGKI